MEFGSCVALRYGKSYFIAITVHTELDHRAASLGTASHVPTVVRAGIFDDKELRKES